MSEDSSSNLPTVTVTIELKPGEILVKGSAHVFEQSEADPDGLPPQAVGRFSEIVAAYLSEKDVAAVIFSAEGSEMFAGEGYELDAMLANHLRELEDETA